MEQKIPGIDERISHFSGRIENFISKNSLRLLGKISKGYSSEIFLAENSKGQRLAMKVEKSKSPRRHMVQKEAAHLKIANEAGIGPKLVSFDLENKIILMEFIDGITFGKWLLEKNPSKKILNKFIDALFQQARKLDEIALDHGQLAGKGSNILVRKKGNSFEPVIIDFEKSSIVRKCKNARQLEGMLFYNKHSVIAEKIRGILGKEIVTFKS